MDRKAPHNVAFDAENRGVSVVLCQVLCLYAFVVGDTPLIDTPSAKHGMMNLDKPNRLCAKSAAPIMEGGC